MATLYAIIALVVGLAAGYFIKGEYIKREALQTEAENERKIRKAEQKAHEIEQKAREMELKAREQAHEIVSNAKDEANKKVQDLEKQAVRLEQKEEDLTKKVQETERQRGELEKKTSEVEEQKQKLEETINEEQEKLEKIAKLSKEEAQEQLFATIEKTAQADLINRMKRAEDRMKEEVDEKASQMMVEAMQRLASEVTSDAAVTPVTLPSDDMKGRIIGKEGRNIQAIERATGCDIIIGDDPGVVIVSGFDLMRRYIAKRSIEKLVEDGRINPPRIEEMVNKVTTEVDKMVKEFGEKAVQETGVVLPPEVVKILGRLRFRSSYGHNVLKHSIEVAFIAEALANMLGADAELSKAAALVHDLGKAVSHEIGGKHAVLTGEILRKFGVDEQIAATAEAHHFDFPVDTIEKNIIVVADAISASRPGARRETAEKFLQRMKDIEAVASSFEGVEKCYAIQAGREVRIFVNPAETDDLKSKQLSWDIARKLESEVQFPGEIKVMVIRETRQVEVAK